MICAREGDNELACVLVHSVDLQAPIYQETRVYRSGHVVQEVGLLAWNY